MILDTMTLSKKSNDAMKTSRLISKGWSLQAGGTRSYRTSSRRGGVTIPIQKGWSLQAGGTRSYRTSSRMGGVTLPIRVPGPVLGMPNAVPTTGTGTQSTQRVDDEDLNHFTEDSDVANAADLADMLWLEEPKSDIMFSILIFWISCF